MIIIRYRCPSCKRYTEEMKLFEKRYEPNTKELQDHPNVAGELLHCKCGRILKWGEMESDTIFLKRE